MSLPKRIVLVGSALAALLLSSTVLVPAQGAARSVGVAGSTSVGEVELRTAKASMRHHWKQSKRCRSKPKHWRGRQARRCYRLVRQCRADAKHRRAEAKRCYKIVRHCRGKAKRWGWHKAKRCLGKRVTWCRTRARGWRWTNGKPCRTKKPTTSPAATPSTAKPTEDSAVPDASLATSSDLPCGGESPARPGGGRYACTFSDDFSGDLVDTTKWLVGRTSLGGMTSANKDCIVDDRDNVSVGQGALRLTARTEHDDIRCQSPLGDFTTDTTAGSLTTRGRFNQAFGRFEFRARFPDTTAPGVHSALWLYPDAHTYGPWPRSGEIDVAEWFSARHERVFPSVHYEGMDTKLRSGYDCVVATAGSTYHRYAVEWTPTAMRFYYDGTVCFEHSWTPTAPLTAAQPFDQPFNVVLTQVFGGGWNAPTSETPQRATTHVDWVRVWK